MDNYQVNPFIQRIEPAFGLFYSTIGLGNRDDCLTVVGEMRGITSKEWHIQFSIGDLKLALNTLSIGLSESNNELLKQDLVSGR